MLFRELNRSKCKTYLIVCENTHKDVPARAVELEKYKDRHIIAICRAGVRSTTAAAILTGLGFEQVSNMKGGMLDWNDQNLPVERDKLTS